MPPQPSKSEIKFSLMITQASRVDLRWNTSKMGRECHVIYGSRNLSLWGLLSAHRQGKIIQIRIATTHRTAYKNHYIRHFNQFIHYRTQSLQKQTPYKNLRRQADFLQLAHSAGRRVEYASIASRNPYLQEKKEAVRQGSLRHTPVRKLYKKESIRRENMK